MPNEFELPIVRLTFEATDLRDLQKQISKMAKTGKKEFESLAKQVHEVTKELEEAKEHQGDFKDEVHATRVAMEKVSGVLRAKAKIKKIDKEYMKAKKEHQKEQRQLQRVAQQEEVKHLRWLAKQGGELAPGARKELRGRRARFAGEIGGAAVKTGRDYFKVISGVLKATHRTLQMIEKLPFWGLLGKLLDYNNLFRFNKEVLTAAGGIDMLGGSLRDGAMAFGQIEEEIWNNAEALHNMGDNIRLLVKADDRLAALRGFETSAIKAREFTDTLGKGTKDVTLQAIALSRVIGVSIPEMSTHMGEFIRNMGISVADIGSTFSTMIADSSEAGISQRFFMDQVRNATSALGMYEFNLAGVSKTLADMTKNSLQPAEVAMRDFQSLLQMGKGLNIGQLGATFQVAMRDSGFQQGMSALTRMIGGRLDPEVFGEGLADKLGSMQRPQFNAMLDEMTATKGLNLDQQRELRSVYDALHALDEGQRGDFFELRQAMQTGALGPDFMALMVNALSKQYLQVEDLRSLSAIQLENLASFIGISAEQLATMKDTIPSTDQIVENLKRQTEGQTEAERLFNEAWATSQRIQKAIESPDQSFEIVMQNLVRVIQKMVVRLVQMLMPGLIDMTAHLLRVLTALFQASMRFYEESIPGGETGDFGMNLWNSMVGIGGGPGGWNFKMTKAVVAATGEKEWWEAYKKASSVMEGRTTGDPNRDEAILRAISAQGKTTPLADQLQQGMVTAYAETAASDMKRLGQLIADREKELGEINRLLETSTGADREQQMNQKRLLESLLGPAKEVHEGGGRTFAKLSARAYGGGIRSGFSGFDASAAAASLRDAADALQNLGQGPQEGGSSGLADAVDRVKAAGAASYVARGGAGNATGGLAVRPHIAAFAEKGPEVNLPLSEVPKVMAETMARAGVGAGVSIGSMHFHLPETAAANVNAFSQAVRRVVFEELRALNKAHRAV